MESSRGEPGWRSIIRSLQLKGAALCYWMFSRCILEPIYSGRGFKCRQWRPAVALLNFFSTLSHFLFLAGWPLKQTLYLWHPALSPRTKPGLRQKGRRAPQGSEQGHRTSATCATGIYFLSWHNDIVFFQVSRWIFCSLTYGSNSQWKRLSVIVVFSQVTSEVFFKLTSPQTWNSGKEHLWCTKNKHRYFKTAQAGRGS